MNQAHELDLQLKGATLRECILKLGNPDQVQRAEVFSAKFLEGPYEVVLTYANRGVRIYVTEDARIRGVLPIKD